MAVLKYIVSFLNSKVSLWSLRNIKSRKGSRETLQPMLWILDSTPLEMLVRIGQKFNFSKEIRCQPLEITDTT